MNDLQALEKAIKIRKEFSELRNEIPVIAISDYDIHLKLGFFNELVGRGVIFNVKRERDDRNKVIHLTGRVDSGDIIIAVDIDGYKAKKEG